MNALEKHAAKKNVSKALKELILGKKRPGGKELASELVIHNLIGQLKGGVAGGTWGGLIGAASGGGVAKTLQSTSGGANLGSRIGAIAGLVKGGKNFVKSRDAYKKNQVLRKSIAAGAGGTALGALLRGGKKKTKKSRKG